MTITIGTTSSANNVVNKNFDNQSELSDCTLREESVSVVNPIIQIQGKKTNLSGYNYAYIPAFKRYYYINDIKSDRTGLWTLSLECDPLMSFKSDIYNTKAIISKQKATHINNYYNDGTYVSEERNVVLVAPFDYRFDGNPLSYILTCI